MNSNIDSIYRLNDSDRVLQGDILKDLDVPIYNKELKLNKLKFGVILSQDCDLNQDYNSRNEISKTNDKSNPSLNNKILPSILTLLCKNSPASLSRR
jgi:hypothetical protein